MAGARHNVVAISAGAALAAGLAACPWRLWRLRRWATGWQLAANKLREVASCLQDHVSKSQLSFILTTVAQMDPGRKEVDDSTAAACTSHHLSFHCEFMVKGDAIAGQFI
eukprot:350149-Chlamydomonas_euryale.AAC.14